MDKEPNYNNLVAPRLTRVIEVAKGLGSFLGRQTLASHGDHVPSWLEPPAETGAEALLSREQGYLADANLEVRTTANSVIN